VLTTLELEVDGVRLGEPVAALLQQCRTLSSLSIRGYTLDDEGTPAIAAAVAQLSSLRGLTLLPADYYEDLSPALIAAAVSTLTALCLPADCEINFQDSTLMAVMHNPQLKVLQIDAAMEHPSSAHLEQLLAACPSLTELDMPDTLLDDQGLEAVLTHGPNITSLSLGSNKIDTSFAARPCKWRTLKTLEGFVLNSDRQPTVLLLARLPLRTVTELEILGFADPSRPLKLELPLGRMPDAQLPAILRQAATNLASCPAWQAGSKSQISVRGDPACAPPNTVVFDAQLRIQLFEALAPLGGPAVKQVELSIGKASFQWGRPEVQALARSLGGQVTTLKLGDCSLQSDFWAALDECFPALTSLQLQEGATCSATDVALFCGTRAAGRPFTLRLIADVYGAVQGEQLQAGLTARGLAHVSVVTHHW
jgi:hypothetical protein